MGIELDSLWAKGLELWAKGGWGMIPLALTALILYGKIAQTRLMFTTKDFTLSRWRRRYQRSKPRKAARQDPGEQDAAIGRLYLKSRGLRYPKRATYDDAAKAFSELRANELPPIDRNLRFIKVAMNSAPLWGLLGTVTGMLKTFAGLASGGGGDQMASSVASGISEALITTQTGLMVALPGYFFLYYLNRKREKYETFIAHLESACTHRILKRERKRGAAGEGDAAVVRAA